jgi:hypothetical protein
MFGRDDFTVASEGTSSRNTLPLPAHAPAMPSTKARPSAMPQLEDTAMLPLAPPPTSTATRPPRSEPAVVNLTGEEETELVPAPDAETHTPVVWTHEIDDVQISAHTSWQIQRMQQRRAHAANREHSDPLPSTSCFLPTDQLFAEAPPLLEGWTV